MIWFLLPFLFGCASQGVREVPTPKVALYRAEQASESALLALKLPVQEVHYTVASCHRANDLLSSINLALREFRVKDSLSHLSAREKEKLTRRVQPLVAGWYANVTSLRQRVETAATVLEPGRVEVRFSGANAEAVAGVYQGRVQRGIASTGEKLFPIGLRLARWTRASGECEFRFQSPR